MGFGGNGSSGLHCFVGIDAVILVISVTFGFRLPVRHVEFFFVGQRLVGLSPLRGC